MKRFNIEDAKMKGFNMKDTKKTSLGFEFNTHDDFRIKITKKRINDSRCYRIEDCYFEHEGYITRELNKKYNGIIKVLYDMGYKYATIRI